MDSHKLRTGFLSREDYGKLVSALGVLVEAPIFIDDTPAVSVSEMRAKCRRLQQSQGRLDMIVVDYLQLASASVAGMGRRYLDVLAECESAVSKNVTENLYERHLKPLFLNGNGANPPIQARKRERTLSTV